jgi:hypothetical protein
MAQRSGDEPTRGRQIPPGAMLDRLVRRDLLLLRLEAARGRRTAMAARVVGTRRQTRALRSTPGR